MRKILVLCSALLFLSANLWADTITFKSGKKVDGNIRSITNEAVIVEIFGVTEMAYDLADVREINGQLVGLKPEVVPEQPKEVEQPATEAPKIEFSQKEKMILGAGAAAVAMTFLGVILLAGLAIYVFCSICLQLIAKKTGTEPAWLAWIPVANLFLSCKIGGLSYLWLLAFLVPFVNVLVSIYIWYKISEARGKPGLLALLMLVPVVNFVFMGYLAFSGSETGTVPPPVKGEEPASPFQDHPYRPPLE